MRKNKKILFVCTGNTCRSPMAEIILKSKLKALGINDIKVWSGGIMTQDGLEMSENSKRALKLLGYKPYGFKSRQITRSMLEKSDVIICMTANHKEYFKGGNVYTIGELTGQRDITDPYGGNINVYIKTSHEIEDACNTILENILKRRGEM